MNHNQQENRPAPGGRTQKPKNVPSHLEQETQQERQAAPREAHEREARRAGKAHETSRPPGTRLDKFGKDMPREQQSASDRQGEGGQSRDRVNPARQSDSGSTQHDLRRDLPGAD